LHRTSPALPGLNVGGAKGLLPPQSVNQMKMPSHLTLDREHRSISQPGFGFSVKGDTD
jgi:hypothetical protein